MNRRTVAILIAVPLTALLLLAALAMPIPYVRFEPGSTVDLLSEAGGQERITVTGHRSYHDGGELRMTTIYATPPRDDITLGEAMLAWIDPDQAVKPYSSVYDDDETPEQDDEQSALQMATSQDVAIAVAMSEAGIDVPVVPVVGLVTPGRPADGKLELRDRFVSIGGARTTTWDDVVEAISTAKAGEPLRFVVERAGKRTTVDVTPVANDGRTQVGIERGLDYHFPFDVHITIDENIGGPSAGLMFALSIYDTLTPGSLTGGRRIAGTGTIDPEGQVGPIGGIQQKIAAARSAKAELFLVPELNCDEVDGAPRGNVRLAMVRTASDARSVIETYADDPDADLPQCPDQ